MDKVELQQRIEDLTEEKRQISLLTDARYHLLAEILISLKELVYLARLINVEDKRSRDADAAWDERGPPEPEETDGVFSTNVLTYLLNSFMVL